VPCGLLTCRSCLRSHRAADRSGRRLLAVVGSRASFERSSCSCPQLHLLCFEPVEGACARGIASHFPPRHAHSLYLFAMKRNQIEGCFSPRRITTRLKNLKKVLRSALSSGSPRNQYST